MSSETLSQDEAIGQFCSVTGADEDRARCLLEACDWNLELAINMHVETDDTNRTRPPIPPVRQILVQNPASYASEIAPRRYSSRPGNASDVYDAFRDFQAEAQWQEREMAQRQHDAESGSVEAPDPLASGSSDTNTPSSSLPRRTLQDLYRPPLDLMFRGSLMSAREAGSLKNKWLLVNIQNVKEFLCQTLNRDVWSNQAVKDILRENFVFWQVSYDSFEGTRYVQFYNVLQFPHVSIIDPRTGEQMKSWPALIDQNSFCHSIIEFLAEHPSPDGTGDANTMKKLRVKEEEGSRTLYDQSEEAQLEAAIKASLKETESKNSTSREIVDEDSYTDAIESDTEQDYTKYLGCDKERSSDLMVRFPDGTRDQFKLPADSLMKALFLLLASRGYSMNQYNYVTNFPRRNLHEIPDSDTLSDAKLVRETIFVEHKISPKTSS